MSFLSRHELLQLATTIAGEADVLLIRPGDLVVDERRLKVIRFAARRIGELLAEIEPVDAAIGTEVRNG